VRQRGRARRPVCASAAGLGAALAGVALAGAALLASPAAPLAAQTMDDEIYTYVAVDELEYAHGFGERPVEYDGELWIGGDYDRLWVKARGEHSTLDGEGGFELEALYSRTVRAFWNLQAGLRVDRGYGGEGATRGLVAVGLEGLAPYWFEVESFLYVSHEGDLSARLEAGYELLFTQRLVLEPEVELSLAAQDVPDFGVASGLDALELSARLRYEIVRELAPYVGVSWVRDRVPRGPDPGNDAPSTVRDASFVAGLRWWY